MSSNVFGIVSGHTRYRGIGYDHSRYQTSQFVNQIDQVENLKATRAKIAAKLEELERAAMPEDAGEILRLRAELKRLDQEAKELDAQVKNTAEFNPDSEAKLKQEQAILEREILAKLKRLGEIEAELRS